MSDQQANFRILVADDEGVFSRVLSEFLKERGFAVQVASEGTTARKLLKEWKPHFMISDLTLAEGSAFDLLKFIAADPDLKNLGIKVFVTSVHNSLENVRAVIKAGATDYLIRPFKNDDLLTRLIFHIQSKRDLEAENAQPDKKLDGADVYMQLMDIVLKEAVHTNSLAEALFKFTKMVAITLKAVRCSVIEISDDFQSGRVMASSDDRNARGIRLDLNRYPEVIHVINTEKAVVIEDLDYNPQLAAIKQMFKNISFNAMMVCPVFQRGQIYGVLSARMDKKFSKFNDRDLRFTQLVAQVCSLVLSSDLALPHEMWQRPKIAPTVENMTSEMGAHMSPSSTATATPEAATSDDEKKAG